VLMCVGHLWANVWVSVCESGVGIFFGQRRKCVGQYVWVSVCDCASVSGSVWGSAAQSVGQSVSVSASSKAKFTKAYGEQSKPFWVGGTDIC
jgi:hypothetical protein